MNKIKQIFVKIFVMACFLSFFSHLQSMFFVNGGKSWIQKKVKKAFKNIQNPELLISFINKFKEYNEYTDVIVVNEHDQDIRVSCKPDNIKLKGGFVEKKVEKLAIGKCMELLRTLKLESILSNLNIKLSKNFSSEEQKGMLKELLSPMLLKLFKKYVKSDVFAEKLVAYIFEDYDTIEHFLKYFWQSKKIDNKKMNVGFLRFYHGLHKKITFKKGDEPYVILCNKYLSGKPELLVLKLGNFPEGKNLVNSVSNMFQGLKRSMVGGYYSANENIDFKMCYAGKYDQKWQEININLGKIEESIMQAVKRVLQKRKKFNDALLALLNAEREFEKQFSFVKKFENQHKNEFAIKLDVLEQKFDQMTLGRKKIFESVEYLTKCLGNLDVDLLDKDIDLQKLCESTERLAELRKCRLILRHDIIELRNKLKELKTSGDSLDSSDSESECIKPQQEDLHKKCRDDLEDELDTVKSVYRKIENKIKELAHEKSEYAIKLEEDELQKIRKKITAMVQEEKELMNRILEVIITVEEPDDFSDDEDEGEEEFFGDAQSTFMLDPEE